MIRICILAHLIPNDDNGVSRFTSDAEVNDISVCGVPAEPDLFWEF